MAKSIDQFEDPPTNFQIVTFLLFVPTHHVQKYVKISWKYQRVKEFHMLAHVQ